MNATTNGETRTHTAPQAMTTPQFRRLLDQCIHCGLCLQNCPTYVVTGRETDAPRGRIQLMRAASEGRISIDGAFRDHIDLCLGCLSCQTACPSGVQYGQLVDAVRMTLAQTRKPGLIARGARWVGLRQAMPYVNRLRAAARLLRLYQRAGLQRLVRSLDILPSQFAAMENILPPLSSGHYDYTVPAPAVGERRGTVALFYGCLQDAFLAEVNAATVHVLQRNGFQVCFPPGQTCCGAAQLHVGETELARDLARKNIDAFLASAPAAGGYTAIVDNAGGCGAVLKEYAAILQDDLAYAEKAQRFVAMVQDVAEFLAAHRNVPPKGFVKSRVTYSDSCHLRNVQGVVRQPRDLIRAIPGVDYVELGAPDRCCGSAGVYNLVNPDMANAILDVRMKEIAATGADTIVTTNTGCHLQLLYGVRRARLNARVIHLVELLDESYRMEVN